MEKKEIKNNKEYYLSYTIDDEGCDETIIKKVEFVSDNLFDYPKLEIGGPIDLIEVDTETNEAQVLHTYVFVNEEESQKRFRKEVDEEGYRKFFINVSLDTLSISPCKIRTDKIQCIDAMYYLMNYEAEHQKRLAELAKKSEEKPQANKPDGSQPGDGNE